MSTLPSDFRLTGAFDDLTVLLKNARSTKSEAISARANTHRLTLTELGGAREDRTPDLLRARQALSQLSYGPNIWWVWLELNQRPHPYQGCALTN